MGSLVLGVFLVVVGLGALFLNFGPAVKAAKNTAGAVVIGLGTIIALMGGVGYNDAGYCQHTRTIFGTESVTCDTGWYALMWGTATQWPHFITVANTTDPDSGGSSLSEPYPVRLADNWNGTVTQATRFGIPQDETQFLKMARDFRSPERLISTTLRPAVTASLDSVANLFTMEEYYAGGQRDAFKTEFRDAVVKGRAQVRQVTSFGNFNVNGEFTATANDLESSDDGGSTGEMQSRRVVMEKILRNGEEIREPHAYMDYGITVSSAIVENLDPDDRFEDQIQARKDAASRRIVAQEERREQEEQRLLAIQRGQTEIAKRQAEAEVEQIERTTNAETERQLALITAERIRQEAEIAKQTSAINLEKARIEAETQQTLADAAAYERRVILEADNALQQKLDAWVEINSAWAAAAADINVPSTVFAMGGEGAGTTGNFASVEAFMALLTANAAQNLDLNTQISNEASQ